MNLRTPEEQAIMDSAWEDDKEKLIFHTSPLLKVFKKDQITPLDRCYWDEGALAAREWDAPLLGKYEQKPLDSFRANQDKHGIVLLDWENG